MTHSFPTRRSAELRFERQAVQTQTAQTGSAIVLLKNGDIFPSLTFARTGGGKIHLPGDLAGGFGVILFHRGSWCPFCTDQLAAFARAADKFAEESLQIGRAQCRERVCHYW